MNRPLLGFAALGCLIGAGALRLATGEAGLWVSALLRVGLVLSALWIALPVAQKSGRWGGLLPVGVLLISLVVIARSPRVLLTALPVIGSVVAVAVWLRPRPPRSHSPAASPALRPRSDRPRQTDSRQG